MITSMPSVIPNLNHEGGYQSVQAWIHYHIERGWKPFEPADELWTHDDNMQASKLGWMISEVPGQNGALDLFTFRFGVSAADMLDKIKKFADINPLCAKAVAVLAQQRIKFPDVKFAFIRK